jgi:aminoglycoside phosphotransferase family enzyme/predicted kinase
VNADELLSGLQSPATFEAFATDHVEAVAIVQTHISIVCLLPQLVLKLKKAHTLPFVDYAPLAAREHYCREEVRLNRRLCPDIYLGVAPLRRTPQGLRFGALDPMSGPAATEQDPHAPAATVDWAVVMRRMPQERMLDVLLAEGTVTAADIDALGRMVAGFHRLAARDSATQEAGSPEHLAQFAANNFRELAIIAAEFLPRRLCAALSRACEADFETLLPVLQQRASRGLVVDGHGDLHARNICLTSPPSIYDCIEFEPAFRCGDVATETAFLVMDLRYRHATDLAHRFAATYATAAADAELLSVLPPLVAYRAVVRAKVAAISALEPEMPEADRAHARESAGEHLRLAAAVEIEHRGPIWLVTTAPPASGKSLLCRALAQGAGWPHMSTDLTRKRLAGVTEDQRLDASGYSQEASDRTYAAVLAAASDATRSGASVVLVDGNFPNADRRSAAQQAATECGADCWFIELRLPEELALQRLLDRSQASAHGSDADARVFEKLVARFEPPRATEELRVLPIDANASPDAVLELTLTTLLEQLTVARTG